MTPLTLTQLLLVQFTLFLTLGLAASSLLRRRPARAHAVLVTALLGAMIAPLATLSVSRLGWGLLRPIVADLEPTPQLLMPTASNFPLTPASPPPTPASTSAVSTPVAAEPLQVAGETHETKLPPGSSFVWPSLASIALTAWLITSTLSALRLLFSVWQARQLLAGRASIQNSGMHEALTQAAQSLGLRVAPELASASINSPVVWCWTRRPIVLVPPHDNSSTDWVSIFCHELAHWTRRDHLTGGLAHLLTILLPWHPLVWWTQRRLLELSEQACDQWAIADGRSAADYAESLLKLLPQHRSRLALAAVSNCKLLVARVERILKSEPVNPRIGRRWLRTLGTICLLTTAVLALVQAAPPAAPGSSRPESQPGTTRITVSGEVKLDSGKPAAGAQVAILGRSKLATRGGDLQSGGPELLGRTTVDGEGRFSLEVPQFSSAKYWTVSALAALPGHGTDCKPIQTDARSPHVALSLPKEHIIRGNLIDAHGQPAAGAMVHVEWIGLRKPHESLGYPSGVQFWYPPKENLQGIWPEPVKSDANGRFELHGLSGDHGLRIQVRDPRFALGFFNLHNDKNELVPEAERTIKVSPSQIITGTVTCADTGKPVPHAPVTIYASDSEFGGGTGIGGFADENGRYELNPFVGSSFQVTAYPAEGLPYLPFRKMVKGKQDAARHQVNIALPRGVLVRGKLTEVDGGHPVVNAGIIYEPRASNKIASSILTGWDSGTISRADGTFQLAVPAGEGTLLVSGPGGDYVHVETSGHALYYGRPGGRRIYPDALIPLNLRPNADPHDVSATLRRGVTIRGRLLGPDGQAINKAEMICRLNVSPHEMTWRFSTAIFGGDFELHGCPPDQPVQVMFLDTEHQWGTVTMIDPRTAERNSPTVRLQPCGSALVRYVGKNKQPLAKVRISPTLIVTPGAADYDHQAFRKGQLKADGDLNANIDRRHYWDGPLTDDRGEVKYPALIPGATYRVEGSKHDVQDFTVQPGEVKQLREVQLDL